MVVGIHQPNFVPWLGYFFKLARVDLFVFFDNVQYSRKSFTSRNRIKTQSGPQWLTVPVRTKGRFFQAILDVEINWDNDWRRKHLNTLRINYGRAPFFDEVFAILESQYLSIGGTTRLCEFNISLIQALCAYLGLKPAFVRARDLKATGNGNELVLNICKELRASTYVTSSKAVNCEDALKFREIGIQLEYSTFKSRPYGQLWGDFVENLSVVDALMNCGRGTRELISAPEGRQAICRGAL